MQRTTTEDVVRSLTSTIARLTNYADTEAIADAVRNALAPLSEKPETAAHHEACPAPGDTVPFGHINAKIIFTMSPDGTEWKPDDTFVRRPLYRGEAVRVEGSRGNWRRTDAARAPISDAELVTVVEVLDAPLG